MAEISTSEATGARKVVRPVLIASRHSVVEYATVLRHLLVGLADESVPVALVCPTQCDIDCVAPVPLEVFSHPLIDMPILERFGIEPLAIQLERFKPTVLHCLCESRATLAGKLAARLDVPYILAVNSLTHRFGGLSISPRRCARLVAATPMIASQVAKSHPGLADRIRQINMGAFAETDIVCFSDTSRVPSIVVACPLGHIGHLVHFFNATKTLLDEGREFMVVVMGSGRAEDGLRRHLASCGLSQFVTVVPILNPWRSVLAAADIFVRSQPSKAFSVFLLEAMGLGAAVAACKDGADSLIIPGKTAVVFDPDKESSVRQTLAQLLDDYEFARSIARSGQEHVRTGYSVSAMILATLKLYAEVQQQYGR